jgi:hypothetical protein
VGERRRLGRAEAGLEWELLERADIKRGERAALRIQARALDLAEASSDPHLVTEANRGYLELRTAAGLTAGGAKPVDAFDALLAELGRAGADTGDAANP